MAGTAVRLAVKSWFADVGLNPSDATGASGLFCNSSSGHEDVFSMYG